MAVEQARPVVLTETRAMNKQAANRIGLAVVVASAILGYSFKQGTIALSDEFVFAMHKHDVAIADSVSQPSEIGRYSVEIIDGMAIKLDTKTGKTWQLVESGIGIQVWVALR